MKTNLRFLVATKAVNLISAGFIGIALLACNNETSQSTPTAADEIAPAETEVSPEIAVLAHRLVFAYMSDKTWGFFGATCERWIEMDYEWDKSKSELQQDGRIKVMYVRQSDRLLGPDELVFYVDIDSGDVQGDNASESERSGIAEGCDQW